uniref:Chaperone protein dnaJ 20, chloroplastic n=1 Tax=Noccaea caerulescens TaxID=107243 RepID=A0A1J3FSW6_NOCCA
MKCSYKGSAILATDYYPFLYKRPISSLPASFPSTSLSYPTRTRFLSTRIQARLIHDDPVKQSEDLSFYDLLGVTESVTLPEIKQAYKQLARKYHPDVSPPDRVEEYTDRFIRVQEAYETLSDPRRRLLYDRDLSMGFSFSFAGRRRNRYDEEVVEEKSEWKKKWQTQLSGLKRRSNHRDNNTMSWAARMRRQHHTSEDSSS